MVILGISPLDKDSTVTIVQDGKVLFAAGEERFTRNKLQDGFPAQALEAGLNFTGVRAADIDSVAYPFFDWRKETELFSKNLQSEKKFLDATAVNGTQRRIREALAKVPHRTEPIHGLADPNEKMQKPLLNRAFYRLAGAEGVLSRNLAKKASSEWGNESKAYHKAWQENLESGLTEFGLLPKLKRYEHHMAHAAAAFYASGFERSLIVTLDGYGSGLAGSVSVAEGGHIRRIHSLEYPHSLGTFYESVTSSLGFRPSRHEGKIVGLAAYGDPDILLDVVLGRFRQTPGDFRIVESNNIYFSRHLASLFPKVDVAAAYQRALEVVASNYIRHFVQKTGIDAVALAGGVAANVKLNQRILEIPEVKRLFIYPNMGDGGCGTGAAFLAAGGDLRERQPYQTVYFGPEYSDDDIVAALRAAGLTFERLTPIEPAIAKLIHEGHVVARFNGRMEYGPRALGNRSILYRATEPDVNQWLNQRLGRTEFMPFAPVTLFEERHRCYNAIGGAEHAAQFMTITFDCTDYMRKASPAAVHVDGTARPQLIREEANPSYYRILSEYHRLSGIPSLINTSFNMHEEPIVNSPADAVRAFLEGNLDYLAIGNFLVKQPSASGASRRM
ncbi:MAG TPA: carbamoyltransferase C-terminal domain-containing protein [Chthoniobacterales bacterium]|jgi:carbamoyltransferase